MLFCFFSLLVINCSQHNKTDTSQRVKVLHVKVWVIRVLLQINIQGIDKIVFKYHTIVVMFLITHLFAQKTNFSLSQHHKCVWVKKGFFLAKHLDVGAVNFLPCLSQRALALLSALWPIIKSALYLDKTAANPCEMCKTEGSHGEVDSSHHREAIRQWGMFTTRRTTTEFLLPWRWDQQGPRGGTHHKMK